MIVEFSTAVFGFTHQGSAYLYAPLRRLLLRVNAGMLDLVRSIRSGSLSDAERASADESLQVLRSLGLVDAPKDAPQELQLPTSFEPTEVTLFLTNRCNLHCIYCYASAGDRQPRSMPYPVGKAAIDTILRNAIRNEEREIRLGFHGGGEPTLEWDTLVSLTQYCREQSLTLGVSSNISIATNGVMPLAKARWIARGLDGANLSFDGTERWQNEQRPLADGRGSFPFVIQTAREFDRHSFAYGVRCTITADSVASMPEIADFVSNMFHCRELHLEPVFECGRCIKSHAAPPAPDHFVQYYRLASSVAASRGLPLTYSGARADIVTQMFCTAEGGAFCVTPSGAVTSCYEALSEEDPLYPAFLIGTYSKEAHTFNFQREAIQSLRLRRRALSPRCSECLCVFHCAGDCLAKRLRASGRDRACVSARCHINQELTKDQLVGMERACADASLTRDVLNNRLYLTAHPRRARRK